MKTFLSLLLFLVVVGSVTRAHATSPNIVMVFIDDMGWGDFSGFGNQDAETANIDQLAAEGIRFSQFYVNAPICSPSRCALTTGQYPQRWKIASYLNNHADNERRGVADWLDPAAPSIARILKQNGYATGHFGKWHLGGQRDVDNAPPVDATGQRPRAGQGGSEPTGRIISSPPYALVWAGIGPRTVAGDHYNR